MDEMDEIHGGTEQFMGFHDWDRLDRQPMGYSEFMMFSWDLQATSYDDWVSENEVYPQLAFGKRKNTMMIHQWIGSRIEKDPQLELRVEFSDHMLPSGKLT